MNAKPPAPPTTSSTCIAGNSDRAEPVTAADATTIMGRLNAGRAKGLDVKRTLRRAEYLDDGVARWHCLGCKGTFDAPDFSVYESEGRLYGWKFCPLCGVKWDYVFRSENRWYRLNIDPYRAEKVDWWWVLQYKSAYGWRSISKFAGSTPAAKIHKRLAWERDEWYHQNNRDGDTELRIVSSRTLSEADQRYVNTNVHRCHL